MASLSEQAVAYIRAGDIEQGRQLLIAVLKQNPRDEMAWLWMTKCVSEPDQKRYCFNRVLKINPQNQHAITGLRRLDNPAPPALSPDVSQIQQIESTKVAAANVPNERPREKSIPDRVKMHWNSGVTGKAVIGCLSLVVLCCLCSIPAALFRPNTQSPVATEILSYLAATSTESPTETTLPTDAPAPTNAPEPTAIATLAPVWTAIIPQTALGSACIPRNVPETGTVVDVVDGDTIHVRLDRDGQIYSVRYIGMDTPENTSEIEYLGEEASARNAQLVSGKRVTLIRDISETDQYGRLLRYVLVEDTFVNYELVAQGYASTVSYPPDIACIPAFQEAEQVARAAGIGLWSNPPTQVRLPTLEVSGSETPCNCSGPDLDCQANFSTHNEAQACYDYCVSQGFGDVFRLDGSDNDGLACEALP